MHQVFNPELCTSEKKSKGTRIGFAWEYIPVGIHPNSANNPKMMLILTNFISYLPIRIGLTSSHRVSTTSILLAEDFDKTNYCSFSVRMLVLENSNICSQFWQISTFKFMFLEHYSLHSSFKDLIKQIFAQRGLLKNWLVLTQSN